MARKRSTTSEYKPEPRVQFNWGFHDGAQEQRMFGGESPVRAAGWRKRFPVYAAGFERGQRWEREGRYTVDTLSTEAWNEYQGHAQQEHQEVDAVDEANAIMDEIEREKRMSK